MKEIYILISKVQEKEIKRNVRKKKYSLWRSSSSLPKYQRSKKKEGIARICGRFPKRFRRIIKGIRTRKREKRSRSRTDGKGPSQLPRSTTLELIRSRKLVTYLYLDTQSAGSFPVRPLLALLSCSFLFRGSRSGLEEESIKGRLCSCKASGAWSSLWRSARIREQVRDIPASICPAWFCARH